MQSEAADFGFYHSPDWGKDCPRIQLQTGRKIHRSTFSETSRPTTKAMGKRKKMEMAL
jgi:hypothetical protein